MELKKNFGVSIHLSEISELEKHLRARMANGNKNVPKIMLLKVNALLGKPSKFYVKSSLISLNRLFNMKITQREPHVIASFVY